MLLSPGIAGEHLSEHQPMHPIGHTAAQQGVSIALDIVLTWR